MPEKLEYVLVGVGVLGAVLVASYMPGIVASKSLSYVERTGDEPVEIRNIDSVPGIDLNSLALCRQQGLM